MPNLFDPLPDAREREVTEVLAGIAEAPDSAESGTAGFRVERIVSHGQTSPADFWYDQDEDEWVCVLLGWGDLQWEDGTIQRMTPGDHVLIPAHTRHRVCATAPATPTVWLAVFGPLTPANRTRFSRRRTSRGAEPLEAQDL